MRSIRVRHHVPKHLGLSAVHVHSIQLRWGVGETSTLHKNETSELRTKGSAARSAGVRWRCSFHFMSSCNEAMTSTSPDWRRRCQVETPVSCCHVSMIVGDAGVAQGAGRAILVAGGYWLLAIPASSSVNRSSYHPTGVPWPLSQRQAASRPRRL